MNGTISMPAGCAVIEIRGETLWLHPDRAVIWPAQRTVIVADTHFGKSAIFGAHGLPVPAGADTLDCQRLELLLHAAGARRLLILGDFLHGALRASSAEAVALSHWLQSLAPVQINVIAGNHDRRVLSQWRPPVDWQSSHTVEGPFRFQHDDQGHAPGEGIGNGNGNGNNNGNGDGREFSLSGHLHPVMRIGVHKRRVRVPVFWWRPQGLVLPSFGLFTGGMQIRPESEDRVFVVGPQRVVAWREG